jgi:DNA-directed RNA polymerase specialized sigma24 family protein
MGLLEKVVQGLPERHRQYLLANRLEGQSFVAIADASASRNRSSARPSRKRWPCASAP